MVKRKSIITAILVLSLFYIFVNKEYVFATDDEQRICKGVFIDTVDISGMTRTEAEAALEDHLYDLRSKRIAITANKPVYKTMAELDYTYEPNDYIDQAFGLGTSGNLIKRFKDLKDIEHGGKKYPLTFTYDENRLREIIEVEIRYHDVQPANATFRRKNGEFVYTDHKVGSKVDVEATVENLKDIIDNWNREDVFIDATIIEAMPEFTVDDLKKCTDILGEFTTEFKSSSEERASNLANGARLINNAVLYPGQEFSGWEFLKPFSLENGYATGGAFSDGVLVDSIAGGVCQVTSTLYNATLFAELKITERSSHSMTVSYLDLSRDAAISEWGKNFKFVNDTEMPILIESFTKNRKITFKIWGYDTRDTKDRKIDFEFKTLEEFEPPSKDKITEDPIKPKSYWKVTQRAYKGYRAELYKIVYEKGKEVSRTKINSSYYTAQPRHVTVGTK